jgi:hypothetical protein
MISDRDFWCAVNLLIRRHGEAAELEARRADLMLERGDRDGQRVWMAIRWAIAELRAPRSGLLN